MFLNLSINNNAMASHHRQKSMQALKREDKVRKCPECGSTELEFDNEEMYCKKCGLVIEE